jgi:hypothetical protein
MKQNASLQQPKPGTNPFLAFLSLIFAVGWGMSLIGLRSLLTFDSPPDMPLYGTLENFCLMVMAGSLSAMFFLSSQQPYALTRRKILLLIIGTVSLFAALFLRAWSLGFW